MHRYIRDSLRTGLVSIRYMFVCFKNPIEGSTLAQEFPHATSMAEKKKSNCYACFISINVCTIAIKISKYLRGKCPGIAVYMGKVNKIQLG